MLYTLFAVALVILAGFVWQAFAVRAAVKKYPAPGKTVTLKSGTRMHVYARGQGRTVVLLSGWGCAVPCVDFMPLADRLVNSCRVVVVEKPGYGYSPTTKAPRDIDTVVDEIHEALQLSGETPPYIFAGHSMAGVEMLRFANRYPKATHAIVGVDAPAPLCYTHMPVPKQPALLIQALMRVSGVMRVQMLSEKGRTSFYQYVNDYRYMDKAQLPRIIQFQLKNGANANVREEIRRLPENARIAGDSVPEGIRLILFVASDTKEKLYDELGAPQLDYIRKNDALVIDALGKHNLQHYVPDQIADTIRREFLN